MLRHLLLALAAPTLLATGAMLTGCTPHIGDHCQLNTDCSIDGTRVCDNSQPNGYCTTFNCTPNACLDNAVCVMVNASVPGCSYNDYQSPSRTHTTLCLAACNKDSDCRQSEGYVCRDPKQAPYNAVIIDDNTSQKVCVAQPQYLDAGALASMPDAAVCQPYGPQFDGGEGGAGDAGDSGSSPDAPADAPPGDSAPDVQPDVAGGG